MRRLLLVLMLLAAALLLPVARNELACRETAVPQPTRAALLPAAFHRPLANTLLSYPEWSIVHAYEDFAGVVRQSGEAAFDYAGVVGGYWRSLCTLTGEASRLGPIEGDMRAMLAIIGVSFTAEMTVKGVWEKTIGRLTAWWRGPQRTPEDTLAASVAAEYAAFLQQTPWYEYPFLGALRRLWALPIGEVSWVRSLERRLALSMEYGGKALYAVGIGALAGAAPAALTINSVITGVPDAVLAADPAVTPRGRLGNGAWVETPRYRAFTDFLRRVAAADGQVAEIAGQERILATVILPEDDPRGAGAVLRAPLQARPGDARFGLFVRVADLATMLRALGPAFEHAYDY